MRGVIRERASVPGLHVAIRWANFASCVCVCVCVLVLVCVLVYARACE